MSNFEKITLRKLNLSKDISNKYLNWMNDSDVHKYTEQKYTKHSLINIRKYLLRQGLVLNHIGYSHHIQDHIIQQILKIILH